MLQILCMYNISLLHKKRVSEIKIKAETNCMTRNLSFFKNCFFKIHVSMLQQTSTDLLSHIYCSFATHIFSSIYAHREKDSKYIHFIKNRNVLTGYYCAQNVISIRKTVKENN